jgi:hypothetical protein
LLAARGLAPEVVALATSATQQAAFSSSRARRAWVRELLGAQAPAIPEDQHGRPLRALGLLAASVDKAQGRRWLELAPLPRPGYVPPAQLLGLLRKLVARPPRP